MESQTCYIKPVVSLTNPGLRPQVDSPFVLWGPHSFYLKQKGARCVLHDSVKCQLTIRSTTTKLSKER